MLALVVMTGDEAVDQGSVTKQAAPASHERQAVTGYRVATAALLLALAAADFVAFGPERFQLNSSTSTSDAVADSVVYCGIMLGIAYYLGRRRHAPGSGQQLTRLARLMSVIPIWGLVQILAFQGVGRLAKRRLSIRNIAITAGSAVAWSTWNDLRKPVAGSVAMAVLQLAGIVLAVQMGRAIPATDAPEPAAVPPPPASADAPEARPGDDMPAADEVIDVAPLAAAARRLYWLAGAMKFGAIFLVVLPVAARGGARPFVWGIAGAAVLAVLAVALLMQEDWISPFAGFAVALGLVGLACFLPVLAGLLAASAAWPGLVLWTIWPAPFLWLYCRQRRSFRLSDAQIQDASRIGHLPRRQGGRAARRVPPPGLWFRGIVGLICGIPVVLAGLVNTIFGVILIQNGIQAVLDRLYAFASGSVHALLAGAGSHERISVALVTPPEPQAFQVQVRGDLLSWGKLNLPPLLALRVPFADFLQTRLEVYGEVRQIAATSGGPGSGPAQDEPLSLVVMPLGVPQGTSYPSAVVDKVAALAAAAPLLLLVQPIRNRPLPQWPAVVRAMRDRGIALPAMDDPAHAIAVLHKPAGEKIVFTAPRNQWGYIALVDAVLKVISRGEAAKSE